ncbi:MAG: hypothetical protein AB7J13_00660 [Pyrinomonadaceae bacterium]
MSCRRMLFPLVLLLSTAAAAQFPTTPTPTPNPNSRQGQISPVLRDNTDFDRMRAIEMMNTRDRTGSHPLLDPKKGIYRIPAKEETEILVVAEPLIERYAGFLKEENTGIIKLSSSSQCISTTDVVVASEDCIAFTMPGAGTSYSFRTSSYRLPRLADVILFQNVFKTGGVLQQVIMAEIGDIAIEGVTLQTKGMKYLTELKPVRNSDEFMRFDAEITKGIEAGGLLYRKGHPVKENSTYILRSIAYRGNYTRTIEGISYDELAFDKRRDVIVAFRVIDQDPAGHITILWRRLKDVEAPKLKITK